MKTGSTSFDEKAMRLMVERHYEDVLAYCRRHAPVSAAEDLTQETFLRFVRRAEAYDERGKPLALLLTIARNACIDAARSAGRAPSFVELDKGLEPSQSDSYAVELESALASLPPDEREALELRFDQGLGVAEAASVMGMSRFAMKRLLKRALAHARSALAPEPKGRLK